GRVLVEEFVDPSTPSKFNIPPGETYQTTCRPRERVFINEVLVRDFVLVSLEVALHWVPVKERATIAGSRAYQLDPVGKELWPSHEVVLVLKNDTDKSLPGRRVSFEEERLRDV